MRIAFLLDENLPRWWLRELRRHAPLLSIWRIGDATAPPTGSPDPLLLEWCEAGGAYLVTNNRTSMPGHLAEFVAQGHHIPGIFIVPPAMSVLQVAEELQLIVGAAIEEEYRDQITYMPLT